MRYLRYATFSLLLALAALAVPAPVRADDGGSYAAPTVPLDCAAPEYGDTCRA